MLWWSGYLVTLLVVYLLVYHGQRFKLWMSVLLLGIAVTSYVVDSIWYQDLPWWLLGTLAMLLLGVPKYRRRYLSRRLLLQFRKVVPPMSTTEQEALEAGSVWWDGELFSGSPQWEKLLNYPVSNLSVREQGFIEDDVSQLCQMLDDWHITHEAKNLPAEVWTYLKQHGYFGMIIPEEYGGKDFSAYAHSQVVMKVATQSIVAAVTIMVPNSLGPAKLLLQYGSAEQKDYYLPRLARGEEIPCFALTAPTAGSDAGAIPDTGVVCYGDWQGEQVLGVKLNWEKRYITLAPVASLIGLAFKLQDPQHLLGEDAATGITLALIPRDTPGVDIGRRHVTLDIPFQNGPIFGKDVFIPITHLIGGKDFAGKGWRMLMECLSDGRAISLPSLSVGAAKLASRYTGAYAAIRRQFNTAIGDFEGIQEALARIAGLCYQMDAARRLSLSALDQGETPAVISAILKYHLTEGYRQVINDAMDIQAGSGICLGPANLLGRSYQAIPIAITVEGANILTRNMIIFGQGALRCHPWIFREFAAANQQDPQKALQDFDHAILGHSRFFCGNLIRSLILGITRGAFVQIPHTERGPVSEACLPYFRKLAWMSAAFAVVADVSMMTLGGALKRKERLSARLGDILSEMYLMSASLKRFEDDEQPEEDLPLLSWACENSLYRIQEALRSLLSNLPFWPLPTLLRLLVFPTGYPFSKPSDRLEKACARILLSPSASRDRLTEGIYGFDDEEAGRRGQFEAAFALASKTQATEKTIRRARSAGQIGGDDLLDLAKQAADQSLISSEELQQLEQMQQLRHQIIGVDSFDNYGKSA